MILEIHIIPSVVLFAIFKFYGDESEEDDELASLEELLLASELDEPITVVGSEEDELEADETASDEEEDASELELSADDEETSVVEEDELCEDGRTSEVAELDSDEELLDDDDEDIELAALETELELDDEAVDVSPQVPLVFSHSPFLIFTQ